MQWQYHIIALVMLVAIVIKDGLAISCVQCNSFSQKDCDTNTVLHLKPCDGKFANSTVCRKMTQEIYYDGDFQFRTVRQCALEAGPLRCVDRSGTYRFKISYCHCDTDGCNNAGILSISLLVTSLAAVAACFLKL